MCRSWLERQQNCPTCRASVIAPPPASQAPAGQAGAPAAAGDPAAPAGVSPVEAHLFSHCPSTTSLCDKVRGSFHLLQSNDAALVDHMLMASDGSCRGRVRAMCRGWRLMWWQERTCTGRMRRCASAGSAPRESALRLPAQAQPRRRGLLEVCECSDRLKAACLRKLSPGKGCTSCRLGSFSAHQHVLRFASCNYAIHSYAPGSGHAGHAEPGAAPSVAARAASLGAGAPLAQHSNAGGRAGSELHGTLHITVPFMLS